MLCKSAIGRLGSAAVVGLVVVVLAGCGKHQTMDEFKGERLAHYQQVRTSLFLQAARQYFETGDLQQAENETLSAMAQDPENPDLHVLLGRIAIERNQLERAYKHLSDAIEFDAEHAAAHYYRGIVVQRWQRFARAMEDYQKAYELEADNAFYLLSVAEMHVALDQNQQAIELLGSKLDYFDQNAGIRLALAQLYTMQQDYEKAIGFYHEASLLAPDESGIVLDLALVQMAAADYAEAIFNFKRILTDKNYQSRLDIQDALAQCYLRQGNTTAAWNLYLERTRNDSSDVEAWARLGDLAWKQGDTASALAAANRVISLAPHRHEGYLLAGMVWRQRGKLEQAVRMFDHAARIAPDNALPVILRGMAMEEAGRRDEAIAAYEEALRRQPDDRRARRLLAAAQQPKS